MKWNDSKDGKERGLKAACAKKKNVIRYGTFVSVHREGIKIEYVAIHVA